MRTLVVYLSVLGALSAYASAQQTAWAQCGGIGWSASTTCVSGYTCVKLSDYYSQCQPGTAATSLTPTPTPQSTPSVTSRSATTTGSSKTPSASLTGTVTASGPGSTLQPSFTWIRAVESPYYHSYLQVASSPTSTAIPAILSSPSSAGQFTLTSDGQLTELISGPGVSPQKLLYAVVSGATSHNGRTLAVTFSSAKNTYGTFGWSGDALQWSATNVTRPNLSAWLVCEDDEVFVNLGSYAYETPDGCADETIHYYGGAQADY